MLDSSDYDKVLLWLCWHLLANLSPCPGCLRRSHSHLLPQPQEGPDKLHRWSLVYSLFSSPLSCPLQFLPPLPIALAASDVDIAQSFKASSINDKGKVQKLAFREIGLENLIQRLFETGLCKHNLHKHHNFCR